VVCSGRKHEHRATHLRLRRQGEMCIKERYESDVKTDNVETETVPNRQGIIPGACSISQNGGLLFSRLALEPVILRVAHAKLTAETLPEVREIPEPCRKCHLADGHLFFEQQL